MAPFYIKLASFYMKLAWFYIKKACFHIKLASVYIKMASFYIEMASFYIDSAAPSPLFHKINYRFTQMNSDKTRSKEYPVNNLCASVFICG